MTKDLNTAFLPCPLCGQEVEYSNQGNLADVQCSSCNLTLSFQKSDELSWEERESLDVACLHYSDEVEDKIRQIALKLWNKRSK